MIGLTVASRWTGDLTYGIGLRRRRTMKRCTYTDDQLITAGSRRRSFSVVSWSLLTLVTSLVLLQLHAAALVRFTDGKSNSLASYSLDLLSVIDPTSYSHTAMLCHHRSSDQPLVAVRRCKDVYVFVQLYLHVLGL